MRRFKILRFISVFLIVVFCISGCNREKETIKPPIEKASIEKIGLGTFSKSLGNAPYHVAKHFKWFEEHPDLEQLKITYTIFNDRPTISQAFDRGDLQMLLSAEVPAILCRAQGNQIKIVEISGIVTVEILARKGLPINSVGDLQGRKLAVLQGTSSHYGLLTSLKDAGVNLGDVKILYMGPAEARTAFETNQIDAWAVWSPFIEEQQIVNKTANVLKGGDTVIANVVTMPSEFIDNNTKTAKALVEILDRAKKWIGENQQEAIPIIAQDLGLKEEIVAEALRKFDYSSHLTEEAIKDFQNKATFLSEQEATRMAKNVDVETDMIDMRFASQEKP
jgi:sulfonate transport system substrate-binding protein